MLRAFTNQLKTFLEDLLISFPGQIDIQTAYNNLDTFGDSTVVCLAVMKKFMHHCKPFYVEIFNNQEEFFTNTSNITKHETFEQLDDDERSDGISKILQMKGLFEGLSDVNKKKMFSYVKGLVVKGAKHLYELGERHRQKCPIFALKQSLNNTTNEDREDRKDREDREDRMVCEDCKDCEDCEKCYEILVYIKTHPELYN